MISRHTPKPCLDEHRLQSLRGRMIIPGLSQSYGTLWDALSSALSTQRRRAHSRYRTQALRKHHLPRLILHSSMLGNKSVLLRLGWSLAAVVVAITTCSICVASQTISNSMVCGISLILQLALCFKHTPRTLMNHPDFA